MYSQVLTQAVYAAMKQRINYFEGQKVILLASRIIATTPGAVQCPDCWDASRAQITVPEDARCLGTGYIIPASGGVAEIDGYLTPVPFDALVSEGVSAETMTEFGVQQSTVDMLEWLEQGIAAKKGDVVIVSDPYTQGDPTTRYLIQDELDALTVGSRIITHRATIALQRRESAVYQIPLPDSTANTPGSWG